MREAVLACQGFAIGSEWMFAVDLNSVEVVGILDEGRLPPTDLRIIIRQLDERKGPRFREMVRNDYSGIIIEVLQTMCGACPFADQAV